MICFDGVKVHHWVTHWHATLSPPTHFLPLTLSHPLVPVRSCEEAQKDYELARKKVPAPASDATLLSSPLDLRPRDKDPQADKYIE